MKIGTIESLALLFSDCTSECFFATNKASPVLKLFQDNVLQENIIILNLPEDNCTSYNNYEAVILKSDLAQQFQKRHITHFLLNALSSEKIESWAHENNIILLSAPWAIQSKWEDKLFFDKFLETHHLPKPRSWILQNEEDINKPSAEKLIIQRPWSWGSQGTFFAKDKTTLQKILIREQKYAPLLCREYIDGIPLGVTLLIGAEQVIFSALRLQAFFLKEDGTKNKYLGIQWIKTDTFSKEFISTLNAVLQKFSRLLQSNGFRGAANLDFLVWENQIYFIECNSRLSDATAQLTMERSLFHGYDLVREFISALSNQPLSANAAEVPNSLYNGATLDLDGFFPEKIAALLDKKVGIYQFQRDRITHVSSNLKDFATHSENILLHHYVLKKHLTHQKDQFGIVMTHFPIFEIQDANCNLSQQGKDFLNTFK